MNKYKVEPIFVQTCPVCMGRGIVIKGFYNVCVNKFTCGSLDTEKCKSCDGKGIVRVN
jgi:predicted methyltransferase